MPAPKGWSTTKLRAATLKRLDRLRSVFAKEDTDEEEQKLSVDATINLLIDEYYQKSLV